MVIWCVLRVHGKHTHMRFLKQPDATVAYAQHDPKVHAIRLFALACLGTYAFDMLYDAVLMSCLLLLPDAI